MSETNRIPVGRTAAFFRVEGTLVQRGALSLSAYLAANGAGFKERLLRLGQVAVSAPMIGLLRQNDRTMATRLAYLSLRGMTEDRVAVLAEEYVDEVLRPRVLDRGVEMMKRARAEGHRVVLLAESIAEVAEPLVALLGGVDDMVCNRLEIKRGKVTGALLEPVIGGHEGGRFLGGYAAEHGIDLGGSMGYAAHGPDLLLLASVGNPCAVNPDFTLRRAAKAADWPVVEYRG